MEIDGYVGLLPVGDCAALVLGDEPASTAYLPDHGTFVRWCAADSRTRCWPASPAALDAAEWEPEVSWRVPGPVLLFDAARPGTACDRADHVRVALAPGRYAVRAAEVRPGPGDLAERRTTAAARGPLATADIGPSAVAAAQP